MEVRWSTLAADDLERIFQRIAKDNPSAARETVKAIYDGSACAEELSTPRPPRAHERAALIGLFSMCRCLPGQGAHRGDFSHLSRRAGLALRFTPNPSTPVGMTE